MSDFTSHNVPSNNHADDIFAFEDQPPPLDTGVQKNQKNLMDEFEDFDPPMKHQQKAGDFHDFNETFDAKPQPVLKNQAEILGDFLANERQSMPRPKHSPPAIPTFETFDIKAEINEPIPDPKEAKFEDLGEIQPDYLNPYASKLESNEKFISTDDLIGLSDNEGKAEKEIAFEDCTKDEEEEIETIPEPIVSKPEPVKVEPPKPVLVQEPPKPKVEPIPAPKKSTVEIKKSSEPMEAEKIFKRIGLGKSNFTKISIKFLFQSERKKKCKTIN